MGGAFSLATAFKDAQRQDLEEHVCVCELLMWARSHLWTRDFFMSEI